MRMLHSNQLRAVEMVAQIAFEEGLDCQGTETKFEDATIGNDWRNMFNRACKAMDRMTADEIEALWENTKRIARNDH